MPVKMVAHRPHYDKVTRTEHKPGETFTVADENLAERLERSGRAARAPEPKAEVKPVAAAPKPVVAKAEPVKPVPPVAAKPAAPAVDPVAVAVAAAKARMAATKPTVVAPAAPAAPAPSMAEEEEKTKAAVEKANAPTPAPATYATRDMKAKD